MTLPNFVGIGAQRAATTWIYNCLKEHPEVFVPNAKELHFFDMHFQNGIAWYEEQFCPYAGQKAIGEITPNYLDSVLAIPRMAQIIPDARLFVVLREPVQRAFSAYQLLYERHYRGMSFREACERSSHLITLGLYTQHLERVFTYYNRPAVKVFLYDDILANPQKMLSELFHFLQIDEDFTPPSLNKIYNRIVFSKTQKFFELAGLNWLKDIVKKTPLGEWVRRRSMQKSSHDVTSIDSEFTHQLKEKFRDDILQLQKTISRDLSHWLA
jgi:hypothetical protein